MRRQTLRVVLSVLLVLLTVCFIFSNSLKNGIESESQSGRLVALFQSLLRLEGKVEEEIFHFYVRKTAHFLEFALLGVGLCLMMLSIRGRFGFQSPAAMLFCLLATAVADEFLQSFTGRTSSVGDVILDFCGGLTGFAVLWALSVVIRKHKQ